MFTTRPTRMVSESSSYPAAAGQLIRRMEPPASKDGEFPRIWVPPLTAAGYTVFVPNHRAAPAFHYPDPVHDIQRAVRFVRHNAARFKVDANRLGGMGGVSWGGS